MESRADLERARRERRAAQNASELNSQPSAPVQATVAQQPRSQSVNSARASARVGPLTSSAPVAAVATATSGGGIFGCLKKDPASEAAQANRQEMEAEMLRQIALARQSQTGTSASPEDAEIAGRVYLDDPVWGRWVRYPAPKQAHCSFHIINTSITPSLLPIPSLYNRFNLAPLALAPNALLFFAWAAAHALCLPVAPLTERQHGARCLRPLPSPSP